MSEEQNLFQFTRKQYGDETVNKTVAVPLLFMRRFYRCNMECSFILERGLQPYALTKECNCDFCGKQIPVGTVHERCCYCGIDVCSACSDLLSLPPWTDEEICKAEARIRERQRRLAEEEIEFNVQ